MMPRQRSHDQHRQRGQEHTDVHARLQHGGQPGSPAPRPGFRQQRRTDRPFPADAQGSDEPEEPQLPPCLGKCGQPREQGVGQDGQHQGACPANAVAEDPKEGAPQGPADQERRLNPGAVISGIRRVHLAGCKQLRDKRQGDQDIEVHVQAVEEPAEPGRQPRLPLLRREIRKTIGPRHRYRWDHGRGSGTGVAHCCFLFCSTLACARPHGFAGWQARSPSAYRHDPCAATG